MEETVNQEILTSLKRIQSEPEMRSLLKDELQEKEKLRIKKELIKISKLIK